MLFSFLRLVSPGQSETQDSLYSLPNALATGVCYHPGENTADLKSLEPGKEFVMKLICGINCVLNFLAFALH